MKNWICKHCNITVASFINVCPRCGRPNASGQTVFPRPKLPNLPNGAEVKRKERVFEEIG